MEQNPDKKISNDNELIINFSIIFLANFSQICKSWFSTEKTAMHKSCETTLTPWGTSHQHLLVQIYITNMQKLLQLNMLQKMQLRNWCKNSCTEIYVFRLMDALFCFYSFWRPRYRCIHQRSLPDLFIFPSQRLMAPLTTSSSNHFTNFQF